jgi:AcrR family transcriptional regulator
MSSESVAKTAPLKVKRQEQIKHAAIEIFSAKGFHNTTMQDIAVAAGLGKGTLYWYWKSKEELAFSLAKDMLSDFLELIEETRTAKGSVLQRLQLLAGKVADHYEDHKASCRLLLKFRADQRYIFRGDYIEKVMSYYALMRTAISEIIQQGIDSGELSEIDPDAMALIFLGIVQGLEIEWLENEDSFSLHEGFTTVLRLMQPGLKA